MSTALGRTIACLLAALALLPIRAQAYDAAADFVVGSPNPNGVWSYGYTATPGSAFTIFDEYSDSPYGPVWLHNLSLGTPSCWKNTSSDSAYGIGAGQASLHPGPGGEYATIRFTAPIDGAYDAVMEWGPGDGGDTDAWLLLNSATSLQYIASTASTGSYTEYSITMKAGDTLDLSVGALGSFYYDNTQVNLRVMPSSRIATALWTANSRGIITRPVYLRAYDLRRLTDNAFLSGRSITFRVDGTDVGSAVADSSGDAALAWTITDGAASRAMKVEYAGDTEYDSCSASAVVTADTVATKTYVPDRSGKVKTYTVPKAFLFQTDNSPVEGKVMTIKVDGASIGTDTTRANGCAQLGYTVPEGSGAGTRVIRCEFAGDGGFVSSANVGKLAVLKGNLYVWAYVRSGKAGTSHPLKAYVRSLPDYVIQPGKQITFSVNGTEVQAASVAADGWATATWAIPAGEPTGSHTATAAFAGDAWYEPVTASTAFNVVP
jgi:hypothetical protein